MKVWKHKTHLAYSSYYYKLSNESLVKLRFIDTISGPYAYRYFSYYSLSNSILLIYDITDKHSFDECKHFADKIYEYCNDCRKILLIGNKADEKDKRVISFEEGYKLAQGLGCPFMEVSISKYKNIVEAVEIAIEIGLNIKRIKSSENNTETLETSFKLSRNIRKNRLCC